MFDVKLNFKNMKNFKTIVLLCFIFLQISPIFSQHQIGHTVITFQDPARGNRAIETHVYYPGVTSGNDVSIVAGQFPVIVFGHGFVMSWDAYENLWEEFVPRGYIMAFPTTEGNLLSTDHQEFGWDLQFLVGAIQNEGALPSSVLFNGVAPETALMGHSMGGGAAFLAADSLSVNGNQNLKTLVGLAPAESTSNGVSSINSAKSITVPAVVMSGDKDGVTPPGDHHIPMYDTLASNCKTFINIIDGWHCYFANPNTNCDFGEGTSSAAGPITRTEQHQITFDFLNPWLDYTLKYDCDAFDEFNDSLAVSSRITNSQQCYSNTMPAIIDNLGVLSSSVAGISYQWYLNGNTISGANQISYTPTQQGNYTVEVFFIDGCSKISVPYVYTTTGVDEVRLKTYKVFPNPAQTYINVEGLPRNQISLYSLQGKQLELRFIDEVKIDVSYLAPGVYFLKVSTRHYKFIKH